MASVEPDLPGLTGHRLVILTSRGRGRRMLSTERILREDPGIAELTEEDVVATLLEELLPFIER